MFLTKIREILLGPQSPLRLWAVHLENHHRGQDYEDDRWTEHGHPIPVHRAAFREPAGSQSPDLRLVKSRPNLEVDIIRFGSRLAPNHRVESGCDPALILAHLDPVYRK